MITSSSYLRGPSSTIRVDNAPGFVSLRSDVTLRSHGISLDYGNVKNVNKNPVAEKCNQELELELLKVDNTGSPVTNTTLQTAVHVLNSRIRNRHLSAKEIVTCRDQVTGDILHIDDMILAKGQENLREQNHPHSAKSKAHGSKLAKDASVSPGSLVYLKSEGDK